MALSKKQQDILIYQIKKEFGILIHPLKDWPFCSLRFFSLHTGTKKGFWLFLFRECQILSRTICVWLSYPTLSKFQNSKMPSKTWPYDCDRTPCIGFVLKSWGWGSLASPSAFYSKALTKLAIFSSHSLIWSFSYLYSQCWQKLSFNVHFPVK